MLRLTQQRAVSDKHLAFTQVSGECHAGRVATLTTVGLRQQLVDFNHWRRFSFCVAQSNLLSVPPDTVDPDNYLVGNLTCVLWVLHSSNADLSGTKRIRLVFLTPNYSLFLVVVPYTFEEGIETGKHVSDITGEDEQGIPEARSQNTPWFNKLDLVILN